MCYAWDTMSGINRDRARFNRVHRHKLALRERTAIREELAAAAAPKTTDARHPPSLPEALKPPQGALRGTLFLAGF